MREVLENPWLISIVGGIILGVNRRFRRHDRHYNVPSLVFLILQLSIFGVFSIAISIIIFVVAPSIQDFLKVEGLEAIDLIVKILIFVAIEAYFILYQFFGINVFKK